MQKHVRRVEMNLFCKEETMKLSLKRIAAVALTVCLLGIAAGTVYGGGRHPSPQPQPQPQPKPQPQPQPKPAQQKSSTSSPIIGSLGSGSSIGSLSNGSTIGSLSSGSMIGSLLPTNSQPKTQPISKPKQKDPEPERGGGGRPKDNPSGEGRPQNNPPPAAEARVQNNPPPQSRPTEQPKPAEGPQVVQAAPQKQPPEQPKQAQTQDPIIIMPRSVRAGNTSGGGSSNRNLPGYSGGDGTGPLIYNP